MLSINATQHLVLAPGQLPVGTVFTHEAAPQVDRLYRPIAGTFQRFEVQDANGHLRFVPESDPRPATRHFTVDELPLTTR